MTYEDTCQSALNYFPCHYGTSKLLFRGPRRRLQGDYVAYLGGIETYGKFIEMPFPTLVECDTGVKSVNLGCVNAGVDAYAADKSLVDICARAKVTVIQIMGAQNMSNRFYVVHPRRNDRFVRASAALSAIYPEIDFTDFHFTGHMLSLLWETSADRFEQVVKELKAAWVARMDSLISEIGGKVVLLWLTDHLATDHCASPISGVAPLFVDRQMIASFTGQVSALVQIVADPQEQTSGLDEMVFAPFEEPAAHEMLGPVTHRRVAEVLSPLIAKLVAAD